MASKRYFDTRLESKAREVHDVHERLEDRERQSQQVHKNLKKLANPSVGHSMARLDEMVGGY